jgi:hypothetical protein
VAEPIPELALLFSMLADRDMFFLSNCKDCIRGSKNKTANIDIKSFGKVFEQRQQVLERLLVNCGCLLLDDF